MSEKTLAELSRAELEQSMKTTGIAGLVVTVAMLVALGYAVFGLLDDPVETQTSFTLIFVAFVLMGVINQMVMTSKQYLQARRDMWEVLQALKGADGS